jgi:hypothetical protein
MTCQPRGLCALLLLLAPAISIADAAPAGGHLPLLDPGKPIACDVIEGRFVRDQCDPATHVCRVAPDRELDATLVPTSEPLARAAPCYDPAELAQRIKEGYRIEPAIADAPPGWLRDARGRVMQFNFDMHRRVWIGGGFAPAGEQGSPLRLGGEAEFGIRADIDDEDGLRRYHLLEGRLDPVENHFQVTALQYDSSHRFSHAPIRITTFVGEPRRFDLGIDVGMYALLGRVDTFLRDRPQTWIDVVDLEPTLDLLRSRDLDSYLRVRIGPSLERDTLSASYVFTPRAGLDGEWVIDRDGFHRLFLNGELARIYFLPERAGRPMTATRFEARAGYELILLAINDQPLSLVLEGRSAWRDDVESIAPGLSFSGLAGLRFSFWAPARRDARGIR